MFSIPFYIIEGHARNLLYASNVLLIVVPKRKEWSSAMMNGFGIYMMMAWMPLVMLFWLVVIVVGIWLLIRWLNQKKSTTIPPYTPPQQSSSQPYEQGYQPSQSAPEAYPESRRPSPPPEYEQPQAQYPQHQEMPPTR
jgi:hypothetical protein